MEETLELKEEIKEEPFEEFLFPENFSSLCALCYDGNTALKLIRDHLIKFHSDISSLCDCNIGLQLQTNLINHLLSHTVKTENHTERKTDYIVESQNEIVLDWDPLPKAQNRRKTYSENDGEDKTKPRHKRDVENKKKVKRKEVLKTVNKIKCTLCPKFFKYKQGAQKHWELEHNPVNLFPCSKENCNSRCKTLKNLHSHLRTHDPPRDNMVNNLQCHHCKKIFPTKKQLSLHFYTHREKFFTCDKCGSKFNNRELVKNHILRHFGLFRKKNAHQKIICDECSDLVFSHKMKRHKMIHHSDEKPFKCEFCTASFSDSRILSDHKNIHLKLKPYKCEFCQDCFRSGANLRLHRLRHTNPDKFRCEECQTSFVTKQALNKHNRKHTENPDLRPFACEYEGCNSTFKQQEHVRIHIKRIHEKTDEVFKCEMCDKTYNRKDALGRHMRKAHQVAKRKTRVFPL